jgi:hypothetical protein
MFSICLVGFICVKKDAETFCGVCIVCTFYKYKDKLRRLFPTTIVGYQRDLALQNIYSDLCSCAHREEILI